jgi:hypothetical protein
MPNAITNSEALVSMGNCDDSIAEIDAMIPRLLKMKKQLAAQKEYIEVALKDANDSGNSNADSARQAGSTAKIVDFRANLYKHQQKIQRLVDTSTDGSLGNNLSTSSTIVSNADKDRAKKNGGGGGDIFTSSQNSGDGITTQETLTNTNIFDGVDLVGAKKFLIGINSILTQSNDISTNATSTEAIIPYSSNSADVGKFSNSYVAGGTHKVNEEILRGLVMHGNNGEKNTLDISEENGIFLREVAGEEIVIDETFAKITQQLNTATNDSALIIDAASVSGGTGTPKLTNKLVVENNNVAKIIITDAGAGYTANDIITIDKNGIPGKSVPVGSTHDTFAGTITYPTEITGVASETTQTGITATPSTTGFGAGGGSLTVDVTIFNNVIINIIVNTYTAGSAGVADDDTFSITASDLQSDFSGSSVTGNTTVTVSTATKLIAIKSINAYATGGFTTNPSTSTDGSLTNIAVTGGSGTGMTLDLTVESNAVTEAIIKTTGSDYKKDDVITVDKNLLPGSSLGNGTTKDSFANVTQEATDAADQTTTGKSVVSVTGGGSSMTVDITIASGAASALTINATGSGYVVGDELKIASSDLTDATADLLFTLIAVPGSSNTDLKFTLTSVPGSSDADLKFQLIKVPGATNTTATTNRGQKIRGFGL